MTDRTNIEQLDGHGQLSPFWTAVSIRVTDRYIIDNMIHLDMIAFLVHSDSENFNSLLIVIIIKNPN